MKELKTYCMTYGGDRKKCLFTPNRALMDRRNNSILFSLAKQCVYLVTYRGVGEGLFTGVWSPAHREHEQEVNSRSLGGGLLTGVWVPLGQLPHPKPHLPQSS